MLPAIRGELTKSQIDLINKMFQTGGRVVIKPTRKQIEGGFLGTLASIGIPMAISLVSKMLGGGLQVDRRGSSNTANVYVPPTDGGGYPYRSPPFFGSLSLLYIPLKCLIPSLFIQSIRSKLDRGLITKWFLEWGLS